MKKLLSLFTLSLALMLMLVGCGAAPAKDKAEAPKQEDVKTEDVEKVAEGYPKTFKDGRGVEITLEQQPQHIISTALSIDEFVLALVDDPSRVAAVTAMAASEDSSNVTAEAAKVADKLDSVTAEQVIALKPDLVIVPTYQDPTIIQQLEKNNVTVYQLGDQASFDGILASITEIGELLGEQENAKALVEKSQERLQAVADKAAKIDEKKRVLYLSPSFSTVTGDTSIGEMIERAGGINVVAEAGIEGTDFPKYPTLSKEKIVELNPDVIITDTVVWDEKDKDFIDQWKADSVFQKLKAFENDAIYPINSAQLSAASQFVVDGVEAVYEALYGDAK